MKKEQEIQELEAIEEWDLSLRGILKKYSDRSLPLLGEKMCEAQIVRIGANPEEYLCVRIILPIEHTTKSPRTASVSPWSTGGDRGV